MKAFLGQLRDNLAAMAIASENQKSFTGFNDLAVAPIDVL